MDIKLKNNEKLSPIMRYFVVILVLSFAVTMFMPAVYKWSHRDEDSFYETAYFTNTIMEAGFALYSQKEQKENGKLMTEEEIFMFDDFVLEDYAKRTFEFNEDDFEGNVEEAEDYHFTAYFENFVSSISRVVYNFENSFSQNWGRLSYCVVGNDEVIASGVDVDLELLARGMVTEANLEILRERYDYWIVLEYGADGGVSVKNIHGTTASSIETKMTAENERNYLYGELNRYLPTEQINDVVNNFVLPNSMTIVLGFPKVQKGYSDIEYNAELFEAAAIRNSGLGLTKTISFFVVLALAIFATYRGEWHFDFADKISPELLLILASVQAKIASYLPGLVLAAGKGRILSNTGDILSTGKGASMIALLLFFILFVFILSTIFFIMLSLGEVRQLGFRGYLKQRSLIIRGSRALYHWIADVDLSIIGKKTVFRVLLINFLVLSIISLFWAFGIFILIIYSIVLYIIIGKYVTNLNHNYLKILSATGEMANGNLDVQLDEDLGVFTSLGRELEKTKEGFSSAVNAEIRSQNMRTELITNVSHDLKTPLTAIITYVGLLKDESISKEDRAKYLSTVERKSQRLKVLIEDLFDMSKASSGNVNVTLTDIDLPSLIRQVINEVQPEIEASGIQFVYRFAPERLELQLDGELSSRIFENLLLNVTKYSLPNTRAYVDMRLEGRAAIVEIKNISKDPLSFDEEAITERFVRGDSSRNTEGSGLGLAIAKTFAELQGGSLEILTDADLFKVQLRFQMPPSSQEEEEQNFLGF